MRSATLPLLVFLFAGTLRSDEIACNSAALAGFWSILASALYGQTSQERAAFVTREASGVYHLQVWRFTAEDRQASYTGEMPRDVVAIVHTHPNGFDYPSSHDSDVARRVHLPVYVLTRTRVSKTVDGHIETLWLGNWNPSARRRTAMTACEPLEVPQR